MRTAFMETGFINEDGVNYGVNLGFDFVAEHEFGTARLREYIGLPVKPTFDNFEDVVIPAGDRIVAYETNTYAAIGAMNVWHGQSQMERLTNSIECLWGNVKHLSNKEFLAAWDEREFLLVGVSDKAREMVLELHKAYKTGNLALLTKPAKYKGVGLCLMMVDMYPQKNIEAFNYECIDRKRLLDASDKTGIVKRLRDAGSNVQGWDRPCQYYALSPKWKTPEHNSEYPVVYWLNPCNQGKNNFGFFTVEELDQWIEGKGPIPK